MSIRTVLEFFAIAFLALSARAAEDTYRYDMNTIAQQVKETQTAGKSIKFYEVCGTEKSQSGGREYCVNDIFADANVQMMQAVELARIYADMKNNHTVVCSGKVRQSWNDDYIRCSDGTNYYEFKFDDVYESIDNKIKTDTAAAICRLHKGAVTNTDACELPNALACTDMGKTMAKFGYSTQWVDIAGGSRECRPVFNSVSSDYELRTAYGIDNEKFKYLQIKSGADLKFLLQRYSGRMVNKSGDALRSFDCNNSFNTMYQNDTLYKDDILTCRVNGRPVDFIFDDMNENIDITADGGTAGLQCIADQGGVFDGKNCSGLTRTQCDAMNTQVTGGTTWDEVLETCLLKSAAAANTLDKATEIATSIGVSGVLIAITGPTGIMLVAISASVAGGMINTGATLAKENEVREFIAMSGKCNSESCAISAISEFLQGAVQYQDDLTGQIVAALDSELARLLELIPENSDFYAKLLVEAMDKNALLQDDFKNWTAAEWAGLAGKSISFIGAVVAVYNAGGVLRSIQNIGKNVKTILTARMSKDVVVNTAKVYASGKRLYGTGQTATQAVTTQLQANAGNGGSTSAGMSKDIIAAP